MTKSGASKTARETPMMRQYLSIKAEVPDAFLFYRMGDFYELFFEDAERAAPLLEITLTTRDKNKPDPIPMCGVPVHSRRGIHPQAGGPRSPGRVMRAGGRRQ